VQNNLAPLWSWTIDFISDNDIDVMCIQETGTRRDGIPSLEAAAKGSGLDIWFSPADGGGRAWLATVARHHLHAHKLNDHELDKLLDRDRTMTISIDRPGRRPTLITNTYGHANNPMLRDRLLDTTITAHRETQLSYIVIGDLNCTPIEGAIARCLANGVTHKLRAVQDHVATRRDGNRQIDYAAWTTAVP
jgi:exonuclease III